MNTAPLLRPMTIGDMFDAAFRLYREHFLTFIGIVALLQVPMAILQSLAQLPYAQALQRFATRPPIVRPGQSFFDFFPFGDLLPHYALILGLGVFQYLIIHNLVTGALANAISRSYHGQPTTILGAYSFGAQRYIAMVLASLVPVALGMVLFALIAGCSIGVLATLGVRPGDQPNVGLIVVAVLGLLGLVLLVIAASIFVYTRLLVTPQAIVLEGQGALAGIGRSWRLIGGSFWRAVAILLLMGILTYFISTLPALIVSLSLTFASRGSLNSLMLNQAITTLVAQIGVIVALPLQLAVYTLLYYDLRVRKEGYDIEVMAQQAAQS